MGTPNETLSLESELKIQGLLTRYGQDIVFFHSVFRAAHKFIEAGEENREMAAYAAYRARESWDYSFPLSEVCAYLKQKPYLKADLIEELAALTNKEFKYLRQLCGGV